MTNLLRRGLLVLLAMLPLGVVAAPTPQQVVQQTTEQLLGDIKVNKVHYASSPGDFYDTLNRILGPVVDVDGISKSIMTVKYSRNASAEQMQRFQENFKRSLLQFYGNALLEYDNQEVRVLPSKGKQSDPARASVNTEVRGSNGTIYPVSYTMVQVDGKWLLRNVIINGINVGKLFRDQFADAMQKNRNNLDKTIDGWAQVVAATKDSVDGQQAGGQQ